uniref:Putative phd finger protein 12 n=1 Tax=Amblyomma triste TaxID=251400 RepID=A0A023GGR2_AMBTT
MWLASLVALQLALATRAAGAADSAEDTQDVENKEVGRREGSPGREELNQLDEKLVRLLAWQRLQQLLGTQQIPKGPAAIIRSELQARAMVCPVGGKGTPVPMLYRTFNLGSGADMDVCLGDFGHCDFVSAKHACVFFDEISKHYELLNYSEHGTTVDNVLYSCDFSEKRPSAAGSISSSPAAVRSPRPVTRRTCSCRANLIGAAGWEGTALLHHGSHIKLGCLQFVFSVTDSQALR